MDPKISRGLALGVDAYRQLVCEYAELMEQARAREDLKHGQSDDEIKRQVIAQMASDHARVLEEEHCRAIWEIFLEDIEADAPQTR